MEVEQTHAQHRTASDGGAVEQAKEQVQQKAEEAKGQASQRLRDQIDTRSTQAGDQVRSFGEALRKAAEHLDREGNGSAAKAAHQAADTTDRLSRYLSESSSDRILNDVEHFGRDRPWVAGALGAALGFVGARFLKASSESRYQSTQHARRDADLPIGRDLDDTASLPAAQPIAPMRSR